MIDYKTLHPAVQKVVEGNLQVTSSEVLQMAGKPLMDALCNLLEQVEVDQRIMGCAAVLGMIWAEQDSKVSLFEETNQVMIDMRDRRAMFDALCEVVYREALEAAKLARPQCN